MGISAKRKSVAKPTANRAKKAKVQKYDDDSDAPLEEMNNESESEDEDGEPEEQEDEQEVDWDSDADLPASELSAGFDFTTVSFGDLAKAQKALDKIKQRAIKSASHPPETSTLPKSFVHPHNRAPTNKSQPTKSVKLPTRPSKHAPQELSSKRPVSRKRVFAIDNKPAPRDPRFDPLAGDVNEMLIRKAYGFLNEYRAKEISELKTAIKKAKTGEEKQRMKHELLVLESKKKAEDRKEREQKIIDEHKKREKELVAQGKTPYYLKRKELKKKVLVEQFERMNKKQIDKAIMRKRKKVAGKEKKELFFLDGRVGRGERESGEGLGFKKRW